MYPYNVSKGGFLGSFKRFNFSGFLDGAQKTLGLVNQTIPLIYQVKPIISNARTMFRIADVVKNDNLNDNSNSTNNLSDTSVSTSSNNSPIFYIKKRTIFILIVLYFYLHIYL